MDVDELNDLREAVKEAEVYYETGLFQQSLECYRSIVQERLTKVAEQRAKWRAADVIIIERLADLAIMDGSVKAAEDLLLGLRELYFSENNLSASAYISIKLGSLALGNDDVSRACSCLNDLSYIIGDLDQLDLSINGLKIWEDSLRWPGHNKESNHVLLVRLYLLMGEILSADGQFCDAINCLKRGESIASISNVPECLRLCSSLRISLAAALLAKGEFESCEKWLGHIDETELIDDWSSKYQTLELRRRLSLLKGQYGEALELSESILTQSRQLGLVRAVAIASLNLAHILILLNQTQNAVEYISDAETLVNGDEGLGIRVKLLHDLAHARRKSLAEEVSISPSVSVIWNSPTAIVSKNENSQDISIDPLELPGSSDFLSFFEERSLAVQWRISNGDFEQASELMGVVSQTIMTSDSPLVHARFKALQGMVDYYSNNYHDASRLLSDAISELQEIGLFPEVWQSRRLLFWCLSRLDGATKEIVRLGSEIQQDLEKLALSLRQEDRSLFLINKWTASDEYFRDEINKLIALEAYAQEQYLWRRFITRFTIKRKLNLLLSKIERNKLDNSSHFLNRVSKEEETKQIEKEFPLWKRLVFHSLRSVTIHFLVLPDRVLLIHHGWFRLGFGVSSIMRSDLCDLVSSWYSATNKWGNNRDLGESNRNRLNREFEHTQEQTLNCLGRALQLQILLDKLPRRINALRIAPDDILHGFPFAVLKHNDKLLPEKFSMSILFPHIDSVKVPRQRVKHALLVGVSQGNDTVPELPHVEAELDTVHAWSKKQGYTIEHLINATADKRYILSGLQQANLLHIACHGVFRADKPGESGFVLLPEPKRIDILSLRELAQQDLRKLEHATLSSCWAADRFILPGRQTIGLPETLLHCGVRSVLACLWPVDDFVAARFTDRFYQYLENYPRDDALQRTQQDCIHGRLIDTKNSGLDTSPPVYWAGFHLYGSNKMLC